MSVYLKIIKGHFELFQYDMSLIFSNGYQDYFFKNLCL